MKALSRFVKQELASIIIVLLSFVPLFFMGAILDILLTRLYTHSGDKEAALPIISEWVNDIIAGHRFLPQEIMISVWLLMVLLFILNAVSSKEQHQFRLRFIYSFLFIWVFTIAIAVSIAFACIAHFDLLLARMEGGPLETMIRLVLLVEIVLVAIIPVVVLIRRRSGD
jgi:hypothetical protein